MKFKVKKKWVIIVILVILLIAGIFFFAKKKDTKKNTGIQSVQTFKVARSTISIKIEETGEIQPIKEISIKSKISGKVIKLYVKENDYVNAGDLIADIEPDYTQARTISSIKNELKVAEIRLRNAEKDYKDTKDQFDKQFVSKQDLDNAKDELEKATLDYKISLDQYKLIKEIDTSGNVSKVYATASGTVIERLIEEGEMVVSSSSSYNEGTEIIKVADVTQMLVKTTINEVDITKIKMNQEADITIDAFPYDTFSGYISKIAAKASTVENVKVFPVEIIVKQKDTRLKPGLTANVTIYGEKKTNILTIPIRAIFSDTEGNDIVYMADKTSVKNSKIVKTGINDLQNVEIIEGLKEGDVISLNEPTSAGKNATVGVSAKMD